MDFLKDHTTKAEENLLVRIREMEKNRIDRGIYFDTTLINKEAYQLFLDENSNDQSCLLPYHEKESRLLGDISDPVIGLGSVDALAFCRWLTIKFDNAGFFRLPKQNEVNTLTFLSKVQSNQRFWIINKENQIVLNQLIPEQCIFTNNMLEEQYDADRKRALELNWKGQEFLKRLAEEIFDFEKRLDYLNDLAFKKIWIYSLDDAINIPYNDYEQSSYIYDLDVSINRAKDWESIIKNAVTLTTIFPRHYANAVSLLQKRNQVLSMYVKDRSGIKNNNADEEFRSWLNNVQGSRRWYIRHITLIIYLFYLSSFSINPFFGKHRRSFLDIYIAFSILEARINKNVSPYEGILIVRDLNNCKEETSPFMFDLSEKSNNERFPLLESQKTRINEESKSLKTSTHAHVIKMMQDAKLVQSINPLMSMDLAWDIVEEGVRSYLRIYRVKEYQCKSLRDMVSHTGLDGWREFWQNVNKETNNADSLMLINPSDTEILWFIKQYSEINYNVENAFKGANFILSELNMLIHSDVNKISKLYGLIEEIQKKPFQSSWNDIHKIWGIVEIGVQSFLKDRDPEIDMVYRLRELVKSMGLDGWFLFWQTIYDKFGISVPSAFLNQVNQTGNYRNLEDFNKPIFKDFVEQFNESDKNAIRALEIAEKILFELNVLSPNKILQKANKQITKNPSDSVRLSWLAVEVGISQFLVKNGLPEDHAYNLRAEITKNGFSGWNNFWSEISIHCSDSNSKFLMDSDGPSIRPLINAYLIMHDKAYLSDFLKRYSDLSINTSWAEEAWVAASSILTNFKN